MRKLIVHEFITLDGVIQAPGGKDEDTDGGFTHGGWTIPYWHDDIGIHFGSVMEKADTLLLGRKTWQTHGAAFDPMPVGDPFGDAMKKIKKFVVSTTLQSPNLWRNSTIIRKNIVEEVTKLKKEPGGNILMDGSSILAHTLIHADLIDEFHLHLYPLVLGKGKRLFPEDKKVHLKLLATKQLPTGVTFLHYELLKQ